MNETNKIILENCAKNFGFDTFDLSLCDPTLLDRSILSTELIRYYRVIPLYKKNNILYLGISDPTDQTAINTMMFYTGLRISPVLVAEEQLNHFIETYFHPQTTHLELTLLKNLSAANETKVIPENTISDEPFIQFVDYFIQHALKQSASDIHIEPYENMCRIRYRQDGILYEIAELPTHLATRLVTRLKVMAKLDIAERRLPQDGRFQLHSIDIRINTCPTLFGEKIVLRLLNANKISLDIQTLGLTEIQQQLFLTKISEPQGMILVTGPTGSGKTVTLYSALHYLNRVEKNISTVEDPIEIQLQGINQVNIHPKIGLDFATALRTFLRQDPDILMVGEIRDPETAEIAIQASQTGHLVLSTVHANSAIETLTRLRSIGIPSYNMVNSISLIIAQRLIRILCSHCKQTEKIPAQTLINLGIDPQQIDRPIFRAVGCQHCLQGYQGRTAIYECLTITGKISELIMSDMNTATITQHAEREGFVNLYQAGLEKVWQGITSLNEINRVIKKCN